MARRCLRNRLFLAALSRDQTGRDRPFASYATASAADDEVAAEKSAAEAALRDLWVQFKKSGEGPLRERLILHYSPLQTGVRFLPSTLVIIVMGPLSGRLTDRVGPRIPMTLGLLTVASALFIQSHLSARTGYGLLLPGFVLMGVGMGLVMSPMSTAAMNAIDRTKAGVASGVLSMSRMVGGSVGLSVMGALVTTIGASKLSTSLPGLSAASRSKIASALGRNDEAKKAGDDFLHQNSTSSVAFGIELSAAQREFGQGDLKAALTDYAKVKDEPRAGDLQLGHGDDHHHGRRYHGRLHDHRNACGADHQAGKQWLGDADDNAGERLYRCDHAGLRDAAAERIVHLHSCELHAERDDTGHCHADGEYQQSCGQPDRTGDAGTDRQHDEPGGLCAVAGDAAGRDLLYRRGA